MTTPTQVAQPRRATVRTVFQTVLAFAAIAPAIVTAIEEATGWEVGTIPFVAFGLASAAGVTRVMALPQVEDFLQRHLKALAATSD